MEQRLLVMNLSNSFKFEIHYFSTKLLTLVLIFGIQMPVVTCMETSQTNN